MLASHREEMQLVEDNKGLLYFALKRFFPKHYGRDKAKLEALALTFLWEAVHDYRRQERAHKLSTHIVNTIKWGIIAELQSIEDPRSRHRTQTNVSEWFWQQLEEKPTCVFVETDLKCVWRWLQFLPARELHILRARCEGRSYDSLGSEFGVTRERIRQIESKAVYLIREKQPDVLHRLKQIPLATDQNDRLAVRHGSVPYDDPPPWMENAIRAWEDEQ